MLTHPEVRRFVTACLGEVCQFGMLFLSGPLDDFTADNGATMIAPGSHRWPAGRRPQQQELVPVVMPAGSALVYSGRLACELV